MLLGALVEPARVPQIVIAHPREIRCVRIEDAGALEHLAPVAHHPETRVVRLVVDVRIVARERLDDVRAGLQSEFASFDAGI